eukprot:TRINITY_DN3974_c0_g2_i1.p1 TRINITY_DN3974_c0_g2~~TRINITY_DN3974_c0_g2_i1.p1  ORF type:complete len:338 (-),score=46.43 TRINITY_DN3974_c0_g2_i1:131-1144(-)
MDQLDSKIAEFLRGKLPAGTSPQVLIICGSGLGGLADIIDDPVTIPYANIEGFPKVSVVGHKGDLVFGKLSGTDVMCMNGRFHTYEGHDMATCTLPVRVAAHLGVKMLFVTNAAGGLNREFKVGDVMIMSDHIFMPGLAGRHPLVGPNDAGPDGTRPRFLALNDAYDPELADLAWVCAHAENMTDFMHPTGTYVMVSGPTYETSAECRMLHGCGADAVGMSTVPECIVARHCGMKVLGFSLITNVAVLFPGDAPPPNHAEVIEATKLRASHLQGLVRHIVRELPRKDTVLASARGRRGCLPAAQKISAPETNMKEILPTFALLLSAAAFIVAFRKTR